MAAASALHRDQRVSIAGKGLGTIAFIGKTDFADGNTNGSLPDFSHNFSCVGDWIGVILDEPKGKNNGTVLKKGILLLYLIGLSTVNHSFRRQKRSILLMQ